MNLEDDQHSQDAEPEEEDFGAPPNEGAPTEADPSNGTAQAGAASEVETAEGPAVVMSLEVYKELKAQADEREDYLKRLQRATADYQNLQKRIARFSATASRNAIREVALQVVPLADSFAQALKTMEGREGPENLAEGLRLIEKEFYTILANLGVEPMEAVGRPFDPTYHEAAFQEPAEGVEPNTVVRELKKGFMIGDELIRPAQVTVAAPPTDNQQ